MRASLCLLTLLGVSAHADSFPSPANGVLPAGAADKLVRVGDKPQVHVSDEGRGPKSELAYAFKDGAREKMTMRMTMDIGVGAGGQHASVTKLPEMDMMFTNSVSGSGEWKVNTSLDDATVVAHGATEEQMAKAMQPQIAAMKGLKMTYVVNRKGVTHDVHMDIPPSVPAAAQQLMSGMSSSLESLVTRLPDPALGIGAHWEQLSRLNSSGADIVQRATFTLTERKDDKFTIEVALDQLAGSDAIHTPQMPAGMNARVKSFHSSGRGTIHGSTTSLTPEGSTITISTAMELTVSGTETSVETHTTIAIGH